MKMKLKELTKAIMITVVKPSKTKKASAWPQTIASVLRGTDNIKTYGESLAQILWFVGVKPMPDSV